MKRITLFCSNLGKAEAFQDKLYNLYGIVELVGWPLFSDDGLYVWAVDDKIG